MENDTNYANGTNDTNDTNDTMNGTYGPLGTNGTNVTVALVPLIGVWYPAVDVPNIMILVLVAVLGFGNLGVILSFALAKSLRKPFNVIVLGMAVGNFVMSDVTAVMELVLVLRQFVPVGYPFCHILVFTKTFSFTQAMFFITLVAVMRVSAGLSKHYVGLTYRRVIAYVVVVYAISFCWAWAWLLPSWNMTGVCNGKEGKQAVPPVLIYLLITSLLFTITVLSYATLSVALACKKAQSVALAGNRKSEILTVKAAVSVSIIFLLCFLVPFAPLLFSKALQKSPAVLHVVHIFNSLTCLQSALDPYVYMAVNGRFRKVYWQSWRRAVKLLRCRRGEVASVTVTDSAPPQASPRVKQKPLSEPETPQQLPLPAPATYNSAPY